MTVVRSFSTDEIPNSTGGYFNHENFDIGIQVETEYTHVLAANVDLDDYVFIETMDISDEYDLISFDSSESKSQVLGDKSKDKCESDGGFNDAEDSEDLEEKIMILADAVKLKLLAKNYLHPEQNIAFNGLMCRCFFNRFSAPTVISKEEAYERELILADGKALKKIAVGYLHPDLIIDNIDPAVFGRNYFAGDDEAEEYAQILSDAAMLKKCASDYYHPEAKVVNDDIASFGRNYFHRFSAPEIQSRGVTDELLKILSDASLLKMHAVSYAHPEITITNTDPASFGRNYFTPCFVEETDGPAMVLSDAALLKKFATYYLHPEVKIKNTDATVFGRSYFTRL